MNADDIVVSLAALNGGRLVGRARLQKGAYLLHRCGANFDLPFVYHHYGPYSFALADGIIDAREDERIEVDEQYGRHGVPYSIFRTTGKESPPERIGQLAADEARKLLARMQSVCDIVLELASAIVYLREEGGYPDKAIEETKARKSLKATDERMERACALLDDLGLSEDATAA